MICIENEKSLQAPEWIWEKERQRQNAEHYAAALREARAKSSKDERNSDLANIFCFMSGAFISLVMILAAMYSSGLLGV